MKDVKVLVKPEKEILAQEVAGYCELGQSCGFGFTCGLNYVSSNEEEEDILF